MKTLLSVVFVAVLSTTLLAQADQIVSKRSRKITLTVGTIRRPNAASKLEFEKMCALAESSVQLNFDRITKESGVRASELWVKTWVAHQYSRSNARYSRHAHLVYQCVMELESRAQKLGFVTSKSSHFYATQDCINDRLVHASLPEMAFQRILNSTEGLGFGAAYCRVERIEVLPVYQGRRGD